MEKILKFLKAEIKGVNEEAKTLKAVVSTINEDRDGDVVLPSAFKERLSDYLKHPVLLADHNYYDLRKQIGMAKDIIVGDSEVVAEFEYFAGKGNEEADWAWELAKKGLSAFSIGFIGLDWDPIESKDENGRTWMSGRKFTKIELMEISQVLIPSNRQALQASAELYEMACKSIKDGTLVMPKKVEKDVEQKPEPGADESREDFMARCVPMLIEEGKDKDQAVAVCSSIWDNKGKKHDDKSHYSEEILGKEDDKSASEPDKVAIEEAVKQGFKSAFKA